MLRCADGAEGVLEPGGYLAVWSIAEIPELNAGYCTSEFALGLVLIGTGGGRRGLGIDTRSGDPKTMRYVALDLVVMDWDEMEHYADSFSDLVNYLRYPP